jgi:metal-responsive CopG/Arc/MetJ family transcriptional regulator
MIQHNQQEITLSEKVKISINIPKKLLTALDSDRTKKQLDRSTWITSAIMEKIASIKKNND